MDSNFCLSRVLRICLLASMGAGGFGHIASLSSITYAQSLPTSVSLDDVVTYDRIQQLRRDLVLTNRDLAVMACSATDAHRILTGLRDWYGLNRSALAQARHRHRRSQQMLDDAVRAIHIGPRDGSLIGQLPDLRQRAETARRERRAILGSAIDQISLLMTSDQARVWTTARANAAFSVPTAVRYVPDLSAQQRDELRQGLASTQVFTTSQRQAIYTARQKMAQHLAGVLTAQDQVLPRPVEYDLLFVESADGAGGR